MTYAFDLDGVLCEPFAPSTTKAWRRMNGQERAQRKEEQASFYVNARPLLDPEPRRFHVITARKDSSARRQTEAWLGKHLPGRVIQLHMLTEGRTIENVVRFKSAVLRDVGAKDYAEDNRIIVNALRKAVPMCRVWHFKNGRLNLDYADAPT